MDYDLNVRLETLKLLKERVSIYQDVDAGKDFLRRSLDVQEIRLTIDKWDPIN